MQSFLMSRPFHAQPFTEVGHFSSPSQAQVKPISTEHSIKLLVYFTLTDFDFFNFSFCSSRSVQNLAERNCEVHLTLFPEKTGLNLSL